MTHTQLPSPLNFSSRNPEHEPLRRCLWEALTLQAHCDYPGAEGWYRQALAVDKEVVDAWCNLGAVLREQGRYPEAMAATLEALKRQPDNASARCNLGILKLDLKEPEHALSLFDDVLKGQPNCFPARFHRSGALVALNRLEEALEAEKETLALSPKDPFVLTNMGYILMKMGHLEESERLTLQALGIDPCLATARWNLSYVRLLMNRWQEAWGDFHYRHRVPDGRANSKVFTQREWSGENFEGQRLLVWAEQGFGDTLHFMRLIEEVKARGGSVMLQVQPALKELVQANVSADLILGEDEEPPEFDLQVALLSLPVCLGLSPETLKDDVPYLRVPPSYVPDPELKRQIFDATGKTRVGLAWTGNPTHLDQSRRSLNPAFFEPLSALSSVQWFSLQKFSKTTPRTELPAALNACDLDRFLHTFIDTAWVVQSMDLVITVDTVIAHMAGAMGIPALLLLPSCPDWRWGQTGESTPWYPTLRLYRQTHLGNWTDVIARVLRDLT